MKNKFIQMLRENWIGGISLIIGVMWLAPMLNIELFNQLLKSILMPAWLIGAAVAGPEAELAALVPIAIFSAIELYIIGACIQSRMRK